MQNKTKAIFISAISGFLMIIMFQNADTISGYAATFSMSNAQITSWYQNLVSSSPGAPGATQYTLTYGPPPNMFAWPVGTEGLASFNSTSNTVNIYVNPKYANDPIGAGWVIQHEFLHGVALQNKDHSLAGEFKTGNGDWGSFDHVASVQLNLIMIPKAIEEYNKAGQTERAAMMGAMFDLAQQAYEYMQADQSKALNGLGAGLNDATLNTLKNAPVVNSVVNGQSVQTLAAPGAVVLSKAVTGGYETVVTVTVNGENYALRLESNAPLTDGAKAALVERVKKAVNDNKATLANSIKAADLAKLKAKADAALGLPLNSPRPGGSMSTTPAFRPNTDWSLSGVLVVPETPKPNEPAPKKEKVASVTIRQLDENGNVVTESTHTAQPSSPSATNTSSGPYDSVNNTRDSSGSNPPTEPDQHACGTGGEVC